MKFYHLIKAKDVDINVDRSNRGDDKVDFILSFYNPLHENTVLQLTFTFDKEQVLSEKELINENIKGQKAFFQYLIEKYCEWLYAEEKEFNLKTYGEFLSLKTAPSTTPGKKGKKKTK